MPPPPGVFLELPAGGQFTVELANNQAFTTLSYGGSKVSDWPDGSRHPEDWQGTSPWGGLYRGSRIHACAEPECGAGDCVRDQL